MAETTNKPSVTKGEGKGFPSPPKTPKKRLMSLNDYSEEVGNIHPMVMAGLKTLYTQVVRKTKIQWAAALQDFLLKKVG